jgi:hypothetical protein
MKFNPIETLKILHESEVMYQNKFLLGTAIHCMKTGSFNDLKRFLNNNPEFMEKAQRIMFEKEKFKRLFPFEIPNHDDFDGRIPIGIINEHDHTFRLSETDLTRHMLVNGASGSGKTVFTINNSKSIVEYSPTTAILGFEPKREYRSILNLLDDFIVITPKNYCQNLFEPPTEKMNPMDWAQIISEIIQLEARFMTSSKNILSDAIIKLYQNKGVLNGSRNYPTATDVQKYLAGCKAQAAKKKDYNEMRNYDTLLNRFMDYVNLGTVFDVRKSIPIEKLMHKNIIFEIENMKSEIYSLMVTLLLSKIFYYRFYHEFDHLVLTIIEEARKIFSGKRDRDYAVTSDQPLTDMMTKSRAKMMGFILVSQEPGSISQVAKSNIATQVLFPLSDGLDFEAAAKSMSLMKEQVAFARKMTHGLGMVRYNRFSEPFIIMIPYKPFPDPPTDKEIEARTMAWFKEIGYNPDEHPPEINPKSEKPKEPKKPTIDDIPIDAVKLMFAINDYPVTIFSDTFKEAGLDSEKGKKARDWLVKNEYIIVHKDIKTSMRKSGMIMELTQKAMQKINAKPLKGKGSFKHRAYALTLARYFEAQGKKAFIEEYVDGKHIDVVCEGTGYEITLHLDNVVENIEKNIAAGIPINVVIVEDGDVKKNVRKILKRHPELDAKIDLIGNYFPKKGQ